MNIWDKQDSDGSKLTKKRGKRLQECRIIKGLTQQELAETVGYEHSNSISQLETGAREITWDKAKTLSQALGVPSEYLMCTSDLINPIPRYSYNGDVFDNIDLLFVQSLQLRGFNIIFNGVSEIIDEADLCISNMNQFVKFSLNVPDSCIIKLDSGEQKEFIIQSVTINELKVSVGKFLFICNRIYDYIDFTFDSLKNFIHDYDMCDATDSVARCAIAERNDGGLRLRSAIASLKKEYGEDIVFTSEQLDDLLTKKK